MIRWHTFLLGLVSSLLLGLIVRADYKFSGTITSVPDALSSSFFVGESINGDAIVGTTPFDVVGNESARYFYSKLRANIGSKKDAIIIRKGEIQIYNDLGGSLDQVKVAMDLPDIIAYPIVPGHTFSSFGFDLQYNPGDLTGVSLLPQFAPATLRDESKFSFDDGALSVGFSLTDFSVVPEPSSLGVVTIGGTLGLRRSRRRRHANQ